MVTSGKVTDLVYTAEEFRGQGGDLWGGTDLVYTTEEVRGQGGDLWEGD